MRFVRELTERVTLEPCHQTLSAQLGAEGRVEANGLLVPVEHLPDEARATTLESLAGKAPHERQPGPLAAVLGAHVEVLEEQDGRAPVRRIGECVEREADRLVPEPGNEGAVARRLTESVPREVVLGDRGARRLVARELAY